LKLKELPVTGRVRLREEEKRRGEAKEEEEGEVMNMGAAEWVRAPP